jgi:dTDP-4-dehydrorhamnose reductase
MRVLVVGGAGMLGHKLVQVFSRDFDVFTTVRGAFEQYQPYGIFEPSRTFDNVSIEDLAALEIAIRECSPDVVVNAVGLIKKLVDTTDPTLALEINSIFPHKLRRLTQKAGARLICISTDCVFSGSRGNYTEDDVPDALDLYGISKRFGEVDGPDALTIRTSIIGRELTTGHNLLEWFLGNAGGTVKGYTDAIFSGMPTIDLADILKQVIRDHPGLSGIFNVSSSAVSKYQLLELCKKAFGVVVEIEPDDSVRIDRSLDSSRFKQATGIQIKTLPEMVADMAADPTPYNSWR